MSKSERYLPLALGLLFALPTLVARYLPMSDLPLHEGVVGVLRHYGDEAWFPNGLYRLNLGHPNQMFHASAWLLSYVVPTAVAVRLVVAIAQVLIFVAGARLARHLGRTSWSIVGLTPLVLGFTYYWGLVANLLGYVFFLWTVPTFDKAIEKPTLRGIAGCCGLFAVLFFAHESVVVMSGAVVGIFAVLRPLSLRKTSARLVPVVFGGALMWAHKVWQERFFTKAQTTPPPLFMGFVERLKAVPSTLFGSHDQVPLLLLFGLALAAAGLLLHARIQEDRSAPEGPIDQRGFARLQARLCSYRVELASLTFFAGYLIAPFNWNGATLLHERFIGPGWALFVLCAAPRSIASAARITRLVGAIMPLGVLLLAWPQFHDASVAYGNLDELIAKIPMRASVTQAVVDRAPFRTRIYSAGPAPARIVAVRGGRIGLSLMISPISPVQVAPEYRFDNYDSRVFKTGSMSLRPQVDLRLFEWLVVASRDPDTRSRVRLALSEDAEFVMRRGEFMLFHSRYPVHPLLEKEPPPPPKEQRQTLVDRLYVLQMRPDIPLPSDDVTDASP